MNNSRKENVFNMSDEENRPEEYDYDVLFEDDPLIRRSDLMPDEQGDFDNRF